MWSFLKPTLTTSELAVALFHRTVKDRTGAPVPDATGQMSAFKTTLQEALDVQLEILVLTTVVVEYLVFLATSPMRAGSMLHSVEPLTLHEAKRIVSEYACAMKTLADSMNRPFVETFAAHVEAYAKGMDALFANLAKPTFDNELTRAFSTFCKVSERQDAFHALCMFEVAFVMDATTSVLSRVKVRSGIR